MRLSSSTSSYSLLVGLGSLAINTVNAVSWNITETYGPNDFFTGFDWFTDSDPTNGLVLFQSQADAKADNISVVQNDQFVMAVDTTEVALEGRKSVRISSSQTYSDGVYVLNFAHVPTGCAVWPAFWTVTSDLTNWPVGGEIDIAENANDQYPSALSSLHTDASCLIPNNISSQTGSVQNTNCSALATGNEGCRVELPSSKPASWGAALNAAGGGIYAMERSLGSTGNGIRVWFFANGSEPADLASGSQSVDTSTWGLPGADFNVADSCHSQFGTHKITFDITLCGDWAGNTYDASGCNLQYPACSYQVGYNGSSFNQSYWSIYDLRVFAKGGGTDNAANSPNENSDIGSSAARLLTTSSILAIVFVLAASFTVSL